MSEMTNYDQAASLPKSKGKWRMLLFGVLILAIGMIIGAGVSVIVVHKVVQNVIRNPEDIPVRISQRMRRKLDLNERQTKRILDIMRAHQKNIQALRREYQPGLEKELDEMRDEVSGVLEPEKARKWRARFEELKRNWLPPLPREK
jgi:uncharacterized protein HemX